MNDFTLRMTKNYPSLLMKDDFLKEKVERKGDYFYFDFREEFFI